MGIFSSLQSRHLAINSGQYSGPLLWGWRQTSGLLWGLCLRWMIQGCLRFTKVSRAGSQEKGGGHDSTPSAALASPLWATCLPPRPHPCQRHQVSLSCMEPVGARDLPALSQVLGQVCLFHFLMGSCGASPGAAFSVCHLRAVQSDGKTFDWHVVRAAFGPNPLLYWVSYWCETWLPWSYSGVAAV